MNTQNKIDYSKNQIINLLFKIQIISIPLVLIIWYLIPGYFPVVLASRMSFYGADGNCVTNGIAIGTHCFGDYGSLINGIQLVDNVWSDGPGTPYPPFSILIMKVFILMNQYLGATAALAFYLLSLCGSMIFPMWHATKLLKPAERIQIIGMLTIATTPFLNVLDRGNNVVWAIPFLYLGLINMNNTVSIAYLSIAIALRPQLAIFLLLILISGKFKKIFAVVSFTSVIYLLSFALKLERDILRGLVDFFGALKGQAAGIPENWPPNLSMARGIKTILETLNIPIDDGAIIKISIFIIFCIFVKIIVISKDANRSILSINIIPLIFLIPPMTWYYYGAFLIVAIAMIIKENLTIEDLGFGRRSIGLLFVIAIWLTFTPMYIPIGVDFNNLIQMLVPICWTLYYITFLTSSWRKSTYEITAYPR